MTPQTIKFDGNAPLAIPATQTATKTKRVGDRAALYCWCLTDIITSVSALLAGAIVYVAVTFMTGTDAINAFAALAACSSFVLLSTGLLSGNGATFASNSIASLLLFILAAMSMSRGVDLLAGVFLLHAFWGGARLSAVDSTPIYSGQRLAWSLFNLSVGLSLLSFGL